MTHVPVRYLTQIWGSHSEKRRADSQSQLKNLWGGSNRCIGYPVEGCHYTLAKKALVYPSQGGRYRAESCMALG
jgi:hypothetical protein